MAVLSQCYQYMYGFSIVLLSLSKGCKYVPDWPRQCSQAGTITQACAAGRRKLTCTAFSSLKFLKCSTDDAQLVYPTI